MPPLGTRRRQRRLRSSLEHPSEMGQQGLAATGVDDTAAAHLNPMGSDINSAGHPLGAKYRRVGKADGAVEEKGDAVAVDEDRQEPTGPSPVIKIDHDIVHSSTVDLSLRRREFLVVDVVTRRRLATLSPVGATWSRSPPSLA